MAANANNLKWRTAIIDFAKKYKVPQITTNVAIAALIQDAELSALVAEYYNQPNDGMVSGAQFQEQARQYLTEGPGTIYTYPPQDKVDPKFEANVELAVTNSENMNGYTSLQLLLSLITKNHNWDRSIWRHMGITNPNDFQSFLTRKMGDNLMGEIAKDIRKPHQPIADILQEHIPLQHEHHDDIATALTLHQAGLYGEAEGAKTPAFLIIGPPNCGINALTEALAQISQNMDITAAVPDADKKPAAGRTLVLSGSDFPLEHSTQLLMGSFAEYKAAENGGVLTNFLAQPGRKVVVFDKIDAAHYNVQNAIADLITGKIDKSRKGQPIDISQTIFIFTAPDIYDHSESNTGDPKERRDKIFSEAKRGLVADLHNVAIRKIFIFKEDTNNEPAHLIDQILQKAVQSLAIRRITLTITEPVREYLLTAYQRYLKNDGNQKPSRENAKDFTEITFLCPIAELIIGGIIKAGSTMTPTIVPDGISMFEQ